MNAARDVDGIHITLRDGEKKQKTAWHLFQAHSSLYISPQSRDLGGARLAFLD